MVSCFIFFPFWLPRRKRLDTPETTAVLSVFFPRSRQTVDIEEHKTAALLPTDD
jgi:hypothetical protein